MAVQKFRVWHKPMQRMGEVLAISFERQKVKIRHLRVTTHMTVPFDDVELMQSTGLLDKNGHEVWEGDVVLVNGWKKVVVSFGTQEAEGNFGDKRIFHGFNLELGGGYPEAVMSEFEIIGNVYQNTELVEV